MNTYTKFAVFFGILLLCLVILLLLRKKIYHGLSNQEQVTIQGAFMFFISLYAFFLAFVIVSLWQTFVLAENAPKKEAEQMMTAFRLSQALPDSTQFRTTVMAYMRSVYEEDWQAMKEGRLSGNTDILHYKVWEQALKLKISTQKESTIYAHLFDALRDAGINRADRFFLIKGNMPLIIWSVVVLGSVFILVSLFLMSIIKNKIQLIIDIIVMGLLLFIIYVAAELERPYDGIAHVNPTAFEFIYSKMKVIETGGIDVMEKDSMIMSPKE
jgi:hypothetical protein